MKKGDGFLLSLLLGMIALVFWVDRENPYVWYQLAGDVLIVLWIFRHDLGLSRWVGRWWRRPERQLLAALKDSGQELTGRELRDRTLLYRGWGFGLLYSRLYRLESDGYVSSRRISEDGRRAYRITMLGSEEIERERAS